MYLKKMTLISLFLVLLVLSACTAGMGGEPGAGQEPTSIAEETGEPTETTEPTPATPDATDGAVELAPEAIEAATTAVAEAFGIDRAELQIERVEDREWPNACLGLPNPGEMCAEVITPGYLIVFQAGARMFHVRTDLEGQTVRIQESADMGEPYPEAYPEPVEAAKAAVAAEIGVDPSELEVISFEEREWTDSCLGLGGPAESCALVITPGWLIMLAANGNTYEVHTDETGEQVRIAPKPGSIETAGDPVIILNRSGGIAGEVIEWRIYADGLVEQVTGPEGQSQTVETHQLDPALVEEMLNGLEAAGFFELSGNYGDPTACCDRFIYTLTAHTDEASNTVQVVEGTEGVPEEVWASIEVVQRQLEGITDTD